MGLPVQKPYTIDDIYALPEGVRAELIDGDMYDMASPSREHQKILMLISKTIANHIDSKGSSCEVYPAPFAVHLFNDDYNYVEPDVSVICDKDKLSDRGCEGAPNVIFEIVSESSRKMDNIIKFNKYKDAGVDEYFIVDPRVKTIKAHNFKDDDYNEYLFTEDVPITMMEGLIINLSEV